MKAGHDGTRPESERTQIKMRRTTCKAFLLDARNRLDEFRDRTQDDTTHFVPWKSYRHVHGIAIGDVKRKTSTMSLFLEHPAVPP